MAEPSLATSSTSTEVTDILPEIGYLETLLTFDFHHWSSKRASSSNLTQLSHLAAHCTAWLRDLVSTATMGPVALLTDWMSPTTEATFLILTHLPRSKLPQSSTILTSLSSGTEKVKSLESTMRPRNLTHWLGSPDLLLGLNTQPQPANTLTTSASDLRQSLKLPATVSLSSMYMILRTPLLRSSPMIGRMILVNRCAASLRPRQRTRQTQ